MSRFTKGDLANLAFEELRISGITKIPSGSDIDKALRTIEGYCAELDGTGYVTGYNFEDDPDSGSETGLANSLHRSFGKVIAVDLMPSFGKGKEPDPLLLKQATGALSVIHRITKQRRKSYLPPTFPIGKHARSRWSNVSRKFYPERESVPFTPSPYLIYEGDITPTIIEDMGQWLQPLDDVDSYTIEVTAGLSKISDSLDGNLVKYVVQATGESNSVDTQAMRVDIVVTTVLGEVRTVKKYFALKIK